MFVTMQQVLAEIDREEPNYPALAKLGLEALPHVKMVIAANDPLKAAKAAYAASLIGGADAIELLRAAAEHNDPQVRIVAAHGLQKLSEAAPSDLVLKSLDDPDGGVRKLGLKTTAMLKRSEFSRRVPEIEISDPAEHLRHAATATAKQLTPSPPAKKAAPKWPRRGNAYSVATHPSSSTSRYVHLALLAAGLVLSAGASGQLPPPRIQPDSGPWDSGAGFHFDLDTKHSKKTRQSVSAMACNLNARQQRICLMAFDEGTQARYAYVGDKVLTPDAEPVVLRATADELDAEGAATDGQYFYVTGSHSAKRGDCASNPGSRHVLRFRLDPATGRALRSPASGTSGALVDYADTGRLWSIMQAQAGLAPHVGENKCLGDQQGVNIEGLAVQGGRLYFGFRGPVLQGVAQVLAVDADALFDAQATRDPKATLTRLALGQNRGIRDMIAVGNGFLVLAGPDDSPASKDAGWVVAWWDGQSAAEGRVVQPKVLAALDLSGVKLRKCDKELKPEAMTVLEETPAAYKLLVLSDGMCDGGPLVFTLAR